MPFSTKRWNLEIFSWSIVLFFDNREEIYFSLALTQIKDLL